MAAVTNEKRLAQGVVDAMGQFGRPNGMGAIAILHNAGHVFVRAEDYLHLVALLKAGNQPANPRT